MNGHFEKAAVAIFVAMVMDGSTAACAAHNTHRVRREYDSLSDMVAFGSRPRSSMYEWALLNLGKFGWLAAFVYTTGAALRLARFNTSRHRRQALLPGSAEPVGGGDRGGGCLVRIGARARPARTWRSRRAPHGRRRASDGQQHPLPELQAGDSAAGAVLLRRGRRLAAAVVLSEPATILFVGFFIYALSGPVNDAAGNAARRGKRSTTAPPQ